MFHPRTQKIIRWLSEAFVSLLLVVMCFTILLFVMFSLFPSGLGLQSLFTNNSLNEQAGSVKQSFLRLLLFQRGPETDLDDNKKVAAYLTRINREVKSKGSQEIAWRQAEINMKLYDHDALQTLKHSAAEVRFDSRTSVSMGPESILIIRQMDDDPLIRDRRTFLLLLGGELSAQTGKVGEKSSLVEVQTPAATIRADTRSAAAADSNFRIRINPDRSASVTVYRGQAEIITSKATLVLAARQTTRIPMDEAPLPPTALPESVVLAKPLDSETYYYRKLPPKICFSWVHQPGVNSFRFIIARDPTFDDVILEETVSTGSFIHGNLKAGTYYWKVNSLGEYSEGMPSQIRCLKVVQDLKPPKLFVDFPPTVVSEEVYILSGQTEPGATVFIDGNKIKTAASGLFKHRINLKPGANVILVESFDQVDNVAYLSQVIHRKI
jgi:hypothetical protein